MSGGHFDYAQYRINDIAADIDELIARNDDVELDEYGEPNGRALSPKTIERFREAAHELRRAAEMAQRVDWLISGDDGEDSFHRRWNESVPDAYRQAGAALAAKRPQCEITCQHCGQGFIGTSSAKYCSGRCRTASLRKRRSEKTSQQKG